MINTKPLLLFAVKETLGSLEHRVMVDVWASQNKVTVRDIVNRENGRFAYTTVMTVANHLYNKGFLNREKIGKTYYYLPVSKKDYVVGVSLSQVFNSLNNDYGKRKILYVAFSSSLPRFRVEIPPYTIPVIYGASITFLVLILTLSIYDLSQNINFMAMKDYLGLLISNFNIFANHLQLFILALFDNLPIIDVLATLTSFILVIVIARKLLKAIDVRIFVTG